MIYQFPIYLSCIAVGVALIFAFFGFILLKKRMPRRLVIISFLLSGLAGGIFAPGIALDRVILDDEKIEQTGGFWFAPTVKGFRYDDVSSVLISTARDLKNREYEVWIVTFKDGHTQEIDPGDLWENNGLDIIKRLESKGIKIKQEKPH